MSSLLLQLELEVQLRVTASGRLEVQVASASLSALWLPQYRDTAIGELFELA